MKEPYRLKSSEQSKIKKNDIHFTRILNTFLIVCFTVFIILILILSSVPPVSRDALTHHLWVPKLYLMEGGIHELPEIIPSYYPQLLDLIYYIPLMFGNDILPKYIHFLFALLTAFLLFLYLKRKLNPVYGFIGAFFFLTLPVIVKLSITVYVDLGLIFFSTASLLSLLKWHKNRFQLKWLIYSAVFCGLALSTKYNGLITFFILTTFTPFLYLNGHKKIHRTEKNKQLRLFGKKRTQLKAAGYGLCFLFISSAVFSPWMIKNYVWTQNPVYPLYDKYFNPKNKTEPANGDLEQRISHFQVRKLVYKESVWETAMIPLRIFFQGEDDNPRLFDGRLNPLLFLLPFFAFLSAGRKTSTDKSHKKILLLFSILYILIVFFQTDMRIRWIGPAIPPLVILSVYGLKNIQSYLIPHRFRGRVFFNALRYCKFLILVLIFITASLNGIYIYRLYTQVAPIEYITGQISRSEYIEKFRPEYAVIAFSNNNLQGDVKLLAFFLGNRGYYSNHPINFNYAQFKHMVRDSKTPEDILFGLKKSQYTNLIINYSHFNTWVDEEFDNTEKIRIKSFLAAHSTRLFSKNGHGVYQLVFSKDPLSKR